VFIVGVYHMANVRVVVVRRRVVVSGRVQGVFFRVSCRDQARLLGVSGWVGNRPDGGVEGVFEGDRAAVDSLVGWCRNGPRGAHVTGVEVIEEPVQGEQGFAVH
jgi:acylphosphatase